MKNVKAILAAAVVAAGLGSSVKAIPLGTLIGDPGYSGKLVFKYTNYDEGQIYSVANPGTYNTTGPGAITKDPSHVFTPIESLDGRFTASDSWGIFIVSSIAKVVNNVEVTVWTDVSQADNIELTGIFWGEKDNTVVVGADGKVSVYGAGTNYAMFYDTAADWDPSSGPTATSIAKAINGTAELTGVGTPIGLLADPTADFKSTYEIGFGNSINTFGIYSNGVSVGATSTVSIGGPVTGEWNPVILPEYQIQFTGVPFADRSTSLWDVRSNDPLAITAIPTPTAVWGGVIMAGFVGLNVIRRRRAE